MAELLTEQGFGVTKADVKTKMDNLKKKYVQENNNIEQLKDLKQKWIHFDRLTSILVKSATSTTDLSFESRKKFDESLVESLTLDDPTIAFEEYTKDTRQLDKVEIETVDLENICRACLSSLSNTLAHYLFDAAQLANKFASCCSTLTKPTVSDNLPKMICTNCNQRLNEFYKFQKICLASDNYLREFGTGKKVTQQSSSSGTSTVKHKNNFAVNNKFELEPNNKMHDLKKRNNKKRNYLDKSLQQSISVKNEADIELSVQNDPLNEQDNSIILYDPILLPNDTCNIQEEEEEDVELEAQIYSLKQKYVSVNFKHDKCYNTTLYKCELCSRNFKAKHCFMAHQRIHQGLIPYPCPHKDCDRGFRSNQFLQHHLDEHEGKPRPFSCDQSGCDKAYYRECLLVEHKKMAHSKKIETNSSYICETCGKTFPKLSSLCAHRYTHRDISKTPFICKEPNCQRRFKDYSNFNVHKLRHAGIKKHQCPICGVRKTTSNELKTHINYHTREKTWTCRYCDKVFYTSSSRVGHERLKHLHNLNFKCSYCEATFNRKKTLKYHEMRHTGEKPFKCDECDKRFRQPDAFRTHCKIHKRDKTKKSTDTDEPINFVELIELID